MSHPVGADSNVKFRAMKTIYAYAHLGKLHDSAFAKTNYNSRGRVQQTPGHRQSPYA